MPSPALVTNFGPVHSEVSARPCLLTFILVQNLIQEVVICLGLQTVLVQHTANDSLGVVTVGQLNTHIQKAINLGLC